MALWPGRVSAGLCSISTTQVGLPVPYLLSTDGCFAQVCKSEVNDNSEPLWFKDATLLVLISIFTTFLQTVNSLCYGMCSYVLGNLET